MAFCTSPNKSSSGLIWGGGGLDFAGVVGEGGMPSSTNPIKLIKLELNSSKARLLQGATAHPIDSINISIGVI